MIRSPIQRLEGPKATKRHVLPFSPDAPITMVQKIKQHRLKLQHMAAELGVSVKTLWGWETDRLKPIAKGQELIAKFLGALIITGLDQLLRRRAVV